MIPISLYLVCGKAYEQTPSESVLVLWNDLAG